MTDPSGMRFILRRFPEQLARGWSIGRALPSAGPSPDRVVIAGMGGSALPGDLLRQHAGPLAVPLEIARDYRVTGRLTRRTLVFASSFSGNTEETLNVFRQARRAGCRLVAVTTGGKLARVAEEAGCPIARIPEDPARFQPRFASGYFFAIAAGALSRRGLIDVGPRAMAALARFLDARMPFLERAGRRLSARLPGRIPLVYTSERQGPSIGRITKIKFNENAKIPSFWNTFPELNHNEMQGFEYDVHPFHFILIRDPAEDPRILLRMDLFRRFLRRRGYPVSVFMLPGETELERVFSGLLFGDWASYYLAVLRGIDPVPVNFIEAFKRAMARSGPSR
ncbi:MAG: bifunctional phosphoglucose/phosphomannose isomerase [Planctomycetes bacterium]|nr:bifunctional phosphoglucose/phosphomannose isomerase [Planctomycetota bacterium]